MGKSRHWLAWTGGVALILFMAGQTVGQGGASKTGDTATFTLPGGAELEMVWIEAGIFLMGTTEEQEQWQRDNGLWGNWMEDEQPVHEVSITQGFWLGKYELTQGQWESVMGTRPWSGESNVQESTDHPAVYISWNDVQAFLEKLNEAKKDSAYRLPTEAEWEYACRAGTTTMWSSGDNPNRLGVYGWYSDNACAVEECYPHSIGLKLPNPWGLYDMHGNVWEWCWDRYDERYYSISTSANPQGAASGSDRVIRGGGFGNNVLFVRSTERYSRTPSANDSGDLGARLVREERATSVRPSTWGQVKRLLQ